MATIKVLESVQQKLQKMSSDEAAKYKLENNLGGTLCPFSHCTPYPISHLVLSLTEHPVLSHTVYLILYWTDELEIVCILTISCPFGILRHNTPIYCLFFSYLSNQLYGHRACCFYDNKSALIFTILSIEHCLWILLWPNFVFRLIRCDPPKGYTPYLWRQSCWYYWGAEEKPCGSCTVGS